ncbi:MAG: lyso-ornithine lipid O-acyltransferase [Rhodothermia bacterium]|nr:MAG: lyso-ornithine lipid O-acyltransferase [Rhodothermia bacterium]
MRHLRAVVRIFAIVFTTGFLCVLWLVGSILGLGSVTFRESVRYHIVHTWAIIVTAVMGMTRTVTGKAPLPPFCLVANHLSYIDILLMLTQVRGVLISRADVRQWPIIGALAYLVGSIFIDRSSARDVVRVNARIESVLSRNRGIIFFPEGTSTRGAEVGPFRSSLLEYPAQTGIPVHFATISYRTVPGDPPACESICWWGGMTFSSHLYELLTIPRFEALIHFGETPVSGRKRKDLTNRLREKIAEKFIPVIQKDHR